MATTYPQLTDDLRAFVERQHMFFVATAPTGADGHVNLSPKGHRDTFAVLDPSTFAYLDLIGSGIETVAHLRENGRITVMLCAFDGGPDIVRLYGTGRVVVREDEEYAALAGHFAARRGARGIIVVAIERVSSSCGFAVPLYEYAGDRELLGQWAAARSDDKLSAYVADRNAESIDGLPGHPDVTSI